MKLLTPRILLLAFPLAASAFIASCATDNYQRTGLTQSSKSGYVTYVSLPADYSGDAYYYNNRYYTGGRYEQGPFSHQGRAYDHRYLHNGRYYYGGEYRPQAGTSSYRGPTTRDSSPTRQVTYRTLPADYAGDAYFYNNRYYAGGRYEQGSFTYRGRNYDSRYIHNGRYFYGGEYRQQASTSSYRGPTTRDSSPTRQVTYRTLPADYAGDAYFYNNRYYSGGRYEPGTYTYRGRTYTHRYIHNGQYLYGGEYRPSITTASTQRSFR